MTAQTPQDEANDMVETLRYDRLKRLERSGEYVDACLAEVNAAVPRDLAQEPLVPPPPSSRASRRAVPLAAAPVYGDGVDELLARAPVADSPSARKPAPFARTANVMSRAGAPKVLIVERRGLAPAWLAFAVVASAVTVAVAVRVLGGPFAQSGAPSASLPQLPPAAPTAASEPEPALAVAEAVAPESAPLAAPVIVAPPQPARAALPSSAASTVLAPAPPSAATKAADGRVTREPVKAAHEPASVAKAPHAPPSPTTADAHAAPKPKQAPAPVHAAKEPALSGEARGDKAARPKAKPREPAPDQSLGDAQLNAAFR